MKYLSVCSGINAGHLRAFLERIERLEAKKAAIAEDIKAVYAEAKSTGYDAKIMRKVIARRKMDAEKRADEEAMLDVYLAALGELADLPLGLAAVSREFGTQA